MNESADEVSTEPVARRGLSRRTMIAATAWSAPAIIVATSTPAMAASPGVVSFTGIACKHSGQSDAPLSFEYHFSLLVKNTTGSDVSVTITSFQKAGTPLPFSVGPNVPSVNMDPKTFTVLSTAGATGDIFVIHLGDDNSAQADLLLTYTYAGSPGQVSGVASVSPCRPQGVTD